VTTIKFPKDNFVEGLFYKSVKDVVGKRVRYPLNSGIILTTGLVSSTPVGSFASSQIPPGFVAISIPITRLTSVSYALQAGDHVSVIVALMLDDLDSNFQTKLPNLTGVVLAPGPLGEKGAGGTQATTNITAGTSPQGRTELDPTLNQPIYVLPSEAQRPRVVSQILISDATVLGVGRFTQAEATKAPTPQGGATTPTPTPAVSTDPDMITLIVTPQDSVTLNYILLQKGAKLNLVMRSASDTKVTKTEAVTLQFLVDQYAIPVPSKLPYGLEPRIDSLDYQGQPIQVPEPEIK
jgi:pilus assembly protein CpaB